MAPNNARQFPNLMMISPEERRKLFRASLELAETSVADFAEAREVSQTHLYRVLKEERKSDRLVGEIDQFIARTIRENRRVLALAS